MSVHCHSGGEQHGPAHDRKCFGVLCDSCWDWCVRFVSRLTRKERS
jgi:hypothetical protein